MVETLSGTGWVGWFNTKNDFFNPFLAKMDKLRATREFSFDILRANGAGENKTFVERQIVRIAMKKKPSGIFCARLAARSFKQEEGNNYSKDDKPSPVITDLSIAIVMAMIVLGNWYVPTSVEGTFGSYMECFREGMKKYTQGFH